VPRLGDTSFDGAGVGGLINFSVIEMPPSGQLLGYRTHLYRIL